MTNWLEAIAGPVFVKEMRELSRKRWFYALRMLQGILLLVVALGVWRNFEGATLNAESYLMPRLANILFHQIIEGQAVVVALIVPWLFTGQVSRARQDGSLDLLLVSPLANHEIVFGLFAGRLILVLSLLASSWPLLGIVMLFGGVSFEKLLWTSEMILMGTIAFAAVVIRFDVVNHNRLDAIVQAYALSAALLLFELLSLGSPGAGPVSYHVELLQNRVPWFYALLFLVALIVLPIAKGLHSAIRDLRPHASKEIVPSAPSLELGKRLTPIIERQPASENESVLELFSKMRAPLWKSIWIAMQRGDPKDNHGLFLAPMLVLSIGAFYVFHFDNPVAWMAMCLLVALATTVIVAASPLFEHRGEMWQAVLATPARKSELVGLILWPLQGSLVVVSLPLVVACLVRLRIDPPAGFVAAVTGFLIILQTITVALALRLCARSSLEAVTLPTAFVAIFAVGAHLVSPMIQTVLGLVILLAIVALLLLGVKRLWSHSTSLRVACDLGLAYTALSAAMTILPLAWEAPWDSQPMAYADPLRWVGMTNSQAGHSLYNPAQFASCWMVLGFSILIGWLYIARRFDRMVGRTSGKARLPPLQ